MYTTSDLTRKFDVSRQTISNWCKEYELFLSPTANPPSGSQRRFVEDDIKVFTLVEEMKQRGMKTDEILAALHSGQRGDLPDESEFLPTVPVSGAMLALQNRITELEEQLQALRTERDKTAGQNELLKHQLDASQQEIIRLSVELARLKDDGDQP